MFDEFVKEIISELEAHHTGKKNSDAERTPIERIMGSQGIAGTAEKIMVIEQKPALKTLSFI